MTGRSERGFSVIEALVSLVVFLGLLAVVMTIYSPSRLVYRRSEQQADLQQNARLAMTEMARQIRMAGFFPENFTASPPDPPIADPIVVATQAMLAVHGDVDSSDASNVFMFCLDGDVLRRARAAKDALGAYVCSGGDILAERVVDLRFTYFDIDGNPVPDPPTAPYQLDGQAGEALPDFADTTQRESVRRVLITLTAESGAGGLESQTYSLASDVWIRNEG